MWLKKRIGHLCYSSLVIINITTINTVHKVQLWYCHKWWRHCPNYMYNATIHFWWLFLHLCSVDCDNIVAPVEVLIMMRQIDFWYQDSVHRYQDFLLLVVVSAIRDDSLSWSTNNDETDRLLGPRFHSQIPRLLNTGYILEYKHGQPPI